MRLGKQEQAKPWNLLLYLDAADELDRDKSELRHIGLTEEEISGYEEFFFRNYFPKDTGEA